jgi:chromosomal replication initiator protein
MPPGPAPGLRCDRLVNTAPVHLASLAPPVPLAAVVELESALRRRYPEAQLHLEVDPAGAGMAVMATLQPPASGPLLASAPAAVIDAVAEAFGVGAEDLRGPSRRRELIAPRQAAMALCREFTDLSYAAIGRVFADRDHTTVLHAVRVAADRASASVEHRQAVEAARARYLRWKGATSALSFNGGPS